MSHELEIVNGKANMAYVGEVPWHGLGEKLPAGASPEQMLKAANLDWEVVKQPVWYGKGNGRKVIEGKEALVRESDNKLFDIVGTNWHPIQNHEAFSLFAEMCEAGKMDMETAGALKGGQVVWGLAKVKKSFELKTPQGKDRVESYLLFTNPHQFGKSADVRFSPIRVVCNNTLTAALSKGKAQARVTHRTAFDKDRVLELLGIADFKLNTYKEAAEHLLNKNYTAESLIEYFNEVFPVSNKAKVEQTADSFMENLSYTARKAKRFVDEDLHAGSELGKGTFWEAFNAVTFLTDHDLGRSADARLQSAWYGSNAQVKANALQKALEYADKA